MFLLSTQKSIKNQNVRIIHLDSPASDGKSLIIKTSINVVRDQLAKEIQLYSATPVCKQHQGDPTSKIIQKSLCIT